MRGLSLDIPLNRGWSSSIWDSPMMLTTDRILLHQSVSAKSFAVANAMFVSLHCLATSGDRRGMKKSLMSAPLLYSSCLRTVVSSVRSCRNCAMNSAKVFLVPVRFCIRMRMLLAVAGGCGFCSRSNFSAQSTSEPVPGCQVNMCCRNRSCKLTAQPAMRTLTVIWSFRLPMI